MICSEVRESDYGLMGYHKRKHLLLQWQNKWKSAKGDHRARTLHGASGGGIWRFNPNAPGSPAALVATFTELRHKKGHKVLVGTRIHSHLELAARCCPNLRPLIADWIR
jgi:hypothetical protein